MVTLVTAKTLSTKPIKNAQTPFCLILVKNSAKSIADSEKVHIFAISN